MAPLDKALATSRKLILVPDGALAYLPFETLLGESRLIERFAIAYAPSASALAALRGRVEQKPEPARTLLASEGTGKHLRLVT